MEIIVGKLIKMNWGKDYNLDFVCAYRAATNCGSLNLMLGKQQSVEIASQVYDAFLKRQL